MALHLPFDNSYGRLPERFYTRLAPTPVAEPGLIAVNHALARDLDLDPHVLSSKDGVRALAGTQVPKGADPLAQVYAGHQFGGWSPQLGDGRAILLGEIIDIKGMRRDLQLKGSGPTPYSRTGDGRACVGPVIREYIVSEAMHALGIPTTRALAAVTTGENVYREQPLPGAVLTRVASSHIRVGTFQFFAARNDIEALRTLADHVMARHYPDSRSALELLDAIIAKHAKLIAQWMGVGFIHGVMNTDNTQVAGETMDYGPCAFMDIYHPGKVFSSIDHFGRYAYGRQPEIAAWNMAQFATSILPLIDSDQDEAVKKATESVHRFSEIYSGAWLSVFRSKLGLTKTEAGDADLIHGLLERMATAKADFTNTFHALSEGNAASQFPNREDFETWERLWLARRKREKASAMEQTSLMRRSNPAVIARNHRIEAVIKAANSGDYGPFIEIGRILAQPFNLASNDSVYAKAPKPDEEVQRTFCGT